MTVQYN